MNGKIYTLADPITNQIRYIGFTSLTLNERMYRHLLDSKRRNNKLYSWFKKLTKQQLTPIIEELDNCDQSNWQIIEQYWIAQFKAWQFNLLNSTEGGTGNVNPSPETRKKISDGNKGKTPWNKGIPCREETKIKLIQLLTGKKCSAETKKKISLLHSGKKMSEEAKKKMSIAQKGHPDYRSKVGKQNQINSVSKPISQYNKQNDFISNFNSAEIACKITGINKSHIRECCTGKRKSAGGYLWKYQL